MATGEQPPTGGPENIIAGPPPTAPANPEAPATAIQGADQERIILPAMQPMQPKKPVSPEALLRRVRFLDAILVVLLLVFAFLAGSFRASNSDVFQHLATGRLIANGAYTIGQDPFTFTAERAWINHSWLLDVLAFFVYRIGPAGGFILVLLKALLVVVLAWLVLGTASLPGRPRWIPVLCSLLAILVASPRLQLQPSTVSFVLLALTLFLLVRLGPASRASPSALTPRSLLFWALPAVCLVWVNVDEWFFLGPLTIALFLLGEFLEVRFGEAAAGKVDQTTSALRPLGLILLACLAACLVNPHHIRAFTLPPALDPSIALGNVPKNPQLRPLFLSPLENVYFRAGTGLSAAGLAYFLLVGLGLASFVATFPRASDEKGQATIGWRWWRVTVWLVFLLLSAWNARAIPFFAVVAGPITALNFLDFAARKFGPVMSTEHGWQRWAVSGRIFTLFIMILIGAASVPGWLQAQPHQYRQLGWGVEVDPALAEAAEQVAGWHRDGLLTGDEKWYNTTPEVVNYFAWFCTDEKGRPLVHGFIDLRLSLFQSAAADFSAVQRSLSGQDLPSQDAPGEDPPPPAWRKILGERGVKFVAFHAYDVTIPLYAATLQRLYSNPAEWQPCYAKGRTALFGWRNPDGPAKAPPFDPRLAVDFDRLAFGPNAEKAPDTRARTPSELPWWREFIEVETPMSMEGSTAVQYFSRYAALGMNYAIKHDREAKAIMAASVIGAAITPGGPLTNGTLLPLRLDLAFLPEVMRQQQPQPMDRVGHMWLMWCRSLQDGGPVSSLYLTLRSTRRAIHENPEDGRSYLILAESYTQLAQNTRERSRVSPRSLLGQQGMDLLPAVGLIRQSQTVSALVSLLALKPKPEIAQQAHLLLSDAFPQKEYLEPHIEHYREFVRLTRELGRMTGVNKEQFREQLDQLEVRVKSMERLLKNRRDQYEVNAAGKPLLQKVRIAQENGLPETVLNLLIKADAEDLIDKRNPQERMGATVAVHLLLGLGRLEEARQVLAPEADKSKEDRRAFGVHPLGLPAYEWFVVQLAAASGDYEAADKALGDAIALWDRNMAVYPLLAQLDIMPLPKEEKEGSLSAFAAMLVGNILLAEAPRAAGMRWQILPYAPQRLNPPYGLKQPGLPATLVRGNQFVRQTMQQQANLWTLRAWLALEQGRTDRVRDYARKALSLSEVGSGKTRMYMRFPSQPLAMMCLQLIEMPGKPEK